MVTKVVIVFMLSRLDCVTADCNVDEWGEVDCPEGFDGCNNLLNLFGAIWHVDMHSVF